MYKEPFDSFRSPKFDRNDYFRQKYTSSSTKNNSDDKNKGRKASYDPHDERYYVKSKKKEVGNYSPDGFEIHHYHGGSNNRSNNRSFDNYASWKNGQEEEEEEVYAARTASPSKRQINKHRRKSRDMSMEFN